MDRQRAGGMQRIGALTGCGGWALVGCGGAGDALVGCGGGVRSPRCGAGGIEDMRRRMWSGGAGERDVERPRAAGMRRGGAGGMRRCGAGRGLDVTAARHLVPLHRRR
jgi:hypothetical protein